MLPISLDLWVGGNHFVEIQQDQMALFGLWYTQEAGILVKGLPNIIIG